MIVETKHSPMDDPSGPSLANVLIWSVMAIVAISGFGALVAGCPTDANWVSYENEAFTNAEIQGVLGDVEFDRHGIRIWILPEKQEWLLPSVLGDNGENLYSLYSESEIGDSVLKDSGSDSLNIKHDGTWKAWQVTWLRLQVD